MRSGREDPGGAAIENLQTILTVAAAGEGRWTGPAGPAMGPRLFGGQAIAQGLMAACGEEDGPRLPHSLHAYFLKPGSRGEAVDYLVTTMSSGRSFATRRVEAVQADTIIFSMIASFQAPEPGFSHQAEPPFALDIDAALESLANWNAHNRHAANSALIERLQKRPIEIVPLDPGALFGSRAREPRTGVWMRMREPTGAGPAMQRALLSYASDMMFLRNAMLPHAIRPGGNTVQATSLDHAIWFHETPDFDRWHLFATESPWAGHARGLNRGFFFSQEGRLVATVSQESLMRPKGEALDRVVKTAQDL